MLNSELNVSAFADRLIAKDFTMSKKLNTVLVLTAALLLTACSNKADTAVNTPAESSAVIDASTASVTEQSVTEAELTENTTAEETQAPTEAETEAPTEAVFPDNFMEIPENAAYKQVSYYNSSNGYHSAGVRFFDSHDNEILIISGNSSGTSRNEIAYEYNENGIVTARSSKDMNGHDVEIIYEYNPDGTLAKETTYTDGEFYGFAVYTYDEHLNPVKREYAIPDEEYNGITEYTYEYDEQGRVIKKITSSDLPAYYAEDNYTYDYKGNLKTITSGKIGNIKIVYSYDEDNRLIMEDHFCNDSWESSTKYVYEFY